MQTRFVVPSLILAAACTTADPFPLPSAPPGMQAISLLGDSLTPTPASDSVVAVQRRQLDSAHAALVADPADPDALIWVGRRLAYMGYYREAIDAFTQGIEQHPDDPRFLRHRGHRYVTTRQFDLAVNDFVRATKLVQGTPDAIEPDGQPNARGVPTSTLQFNIWYHLGLAQYLTGDFQRALSSYRECLNVSTNPDAVAATSHWLYMTLRRLGQRAEAAQVLAAITPDMEIIENDAYFQLLLMYKGLIPPDTLLAQARRDNALQNATMGYGIANWYLYNGDTTRGMDLVREILTGTSWASFGYLAAEAEQARAREGGSPGR